jgi:hypothetical protein
MRLRLILAAMSVAILLAASVVPPPVGGAGPTPPALLDQFIYLPLISVPAPTPTLTPTPPATATPTVTPTPSITPTPLAVCQGDEEMSFAPNPGATGSLLAVSVTSARASVNVALQVAYGGAGVALAGPSVTSGGKGHIWTWNLTPVQPGRYDASFYVNQSDFCAGGNVQVNGSALPTATRTATPRATATPTPAPTAPPGPLEWDWRLTFLNIQLTRPGGSPRWSVVKGIFQDWNQSGNDHTIYVDVQDANGNRVSLAEGTTIGVLTWPGGSVPLQWGSKPPNEYPVNFPMSGYTLGAYSLWLTLDGLPSDKLAGMGMVATDANGNLIAEPGPCHVNYLFTYRRSAAQALSTESARSSPDCTPGRRWLPSPPGKLPQPEGSGPATSLLRLQPVTPGLACQGPGL